MGTSRSMWKGALKVGLVSVPVRLVSASEKPAGFTFHKLHDSCKSRLKHKSWCPTCQKEVAGDESVRGFEYKRGEHVIVTDAEVDACEQGSSLTMTVVTVTAVRTNPLFIESSAFLVPDGPLAAQPFETLRQALGTATAIAHVGIRQKAYAAALTAGQEGGFTVLLLRAKEEVRDVADLQPATSAPTTADVTMAQQLFGSLRGTFDYEGPRNEYTERMRLLLEAKIAGKPVAVPAAPRAAVTSFTEALAQSLTLVQNRPGASKLPAKATARAKAAIAPARKRAAR